METSITPFWEKEPGDEFDQIKTLAKLDWTPEDFRWNGKVLSVRAFGDEEGRVLLALFDKTKPGDPTSVGFFSGKVTEDWAEVKRAVLPDNTNGLKDIGIVKKDFHGAHGVWINEAYRSVGSNGPSDLAYLFHAVFLATMKERGVSSVVYRYDVTHSPTRTPQFVDRDGVAGRISKPSFYTKFTDVIDQSLMDESPELKDTIVSTDLTSVQWSMLKQAFSR